MENIEISVYGNRASVISSPMLTSGTVGLPVAFKFDHQWNELSKTAVFKAGNVVKDQVNIENTTIVPHEVLLKPKKNLEIGVYGVRGDGNIVIPTIWVNIGVIQPGADPSGDESADPTLPVWEQVAKDALEYVKQNLTPLDMSGHKIFNVANGVDDWDAATVGQVKEMVKEAGESAKTAKAYYSTFTGAVTDLNAGTTENADATKENAACYLSKDADGNTCLVLLSDVQLTGNVEITVDVILNVNGHTIFFAGDYSLKFSGDRSILDCRVEDSRIDKTIDIAAATVYTIDFAGAYGELLGGEISYSASSVNPNALSKVTPYVLANNRNNRLLIDGCKISAEFGGGDTSNKNVVVVANECVIRNSNISGFVYGDVSASNQPVSMYSVSVVNVAKKCCIENCEIVASSTHGCTYAYGLFALKNNNPNSIEINNSNAYVDCLSSGGSAICIGENCVANITNTVAFADGTTGSVAAGNENYAGTQGVMNYGIMTLENCTVYGTHTGLQCQNGSVTKINGGLYKGTGHGGVYISCADGGQFYAENATFQNAHYEGKHKSEYFYDNGQYLVAAVYVGAGNDIKAYMDNCILDGNGPALYPNNGDENDLSGAEPIRFRHSSGEQRNSAFMSNCTLMGDGKIRFANSTHKLYLGFANRVLCEPNLEFCLDKTTYAGKVFTSWEE